MLFKSSVHLLIYSSILFVINSNKNFPKHSKREVSSNYKPKCRAQATALDQVVNYDIQSAKSVPDNYSAEMPHWRKKRFVLFPEFVNYLGDQRYLQRAPEIRYWIANFYPNRINSDYIHRYVRHVIEQINTVIDNDIILNEATDPGDANFHFLFFDYSQCPMDDKEATTENIQTIETLPIYTAELTRKSRYRANGGIYIVESNKPISAVKFNMQQTFIQSDDFVYDPIIYSCISDETNICVIDLYYVLLHEALHGFGIEHTTNAEAPIAPNPQMKSVMFFSNIRLLCHDDIRAIRMVYKLPIKRSNAAYDDTCRRDFPMSKLQKFMYLLGKAILLFLILFLIASTIAFILTLIYILIRYLINRKSNQSEKPTKDKKSKHTGKPHGYLWHDEML